MEYILENEIRKCREQDLTREELNETAEYVLKTLSAYRIIIYGAGDAGKAIQAVLKKEAIDVDFFVDKKYNEIVEINGTQVKKPSDLVEINDSNSLVIISVDPQMFVNYKDEIETIIQGNAPLCKVVSYGRGLLHILKKQKCVGRVESGEELCIHDCLQCGGEDGHCIAFLDFLKNRSVISKGEGKSKKFNWYVGYIMGQNCTLRCQNCCEMVPYLNSKGFVPKEDIISDCKIIAEACEFLMYMELVGGEPFLHPDLCEVLKKMLKIPNVGYIKIFTNGTIVPKKELCQILKNKRIVVVLSNYSDVVQGRLLKNINQTKEIFKENDIRYMYSYSKTWLDFRSFDLVVEDEKQLQKHYEACHIANCHRVYEGILYCCPHQYAGVQLKQLEMNDRDYINIRECSQEELAAKLDNITKLEYVDACKYCKMPFDAEEIEAAIQL